MAGLQPGFIPPDPSIYHRVANVTKPTKKGRSCVQKFTELRTEYHDQKAIFLNILYTKVEGNYSPTFLTYPDLPITSGTYPQMSDGPINPAPPQMGHNGIFFLPRGGRMFQDLASRLPTVMGLNNTPVHTSFTQSAFGQFHHNIANALGQRITAQDGFYVHRDPINNTSLDTVVQNTVWQNCKF